MNLFAQATKAPSNGASKAEDFQPLTRNPQTAQGGLQPGAGAQSTSGQDILSNENARIVVPTGNAQTVTPPPPTPSGGVNWFLVIAIAAVIVVALEYVFRRREKPGRSKPVDSSPQEVLVVPADEPVPAPAAEDPKQKLKKSAAQRAVAKSSSKKKSKSKRKKSHK